METGSRRRARSWGGAAWRLARIAIVNALVVVALLGAVELASRRLAPTPLRQPLVTDRFAHWMSTHALDPLLFWRSTLRLAPDGTVVINELGWRGPLPGGKAPDEYRILSLGESTTSAVRLELEQTYSSVLERELGTLDGRRVRVVNAGVGGYTLAQGVALFERDGLPLEPDMVLTYFGHNDFMRVAFRARRDAALNVSRGVSDLELQRRRRRLGNRIALWLHGRSNFARWLQRPDEVAPIRLGSEPRVPLADRRRLYGRLRRLCSRQGVRLVVLVPVYREFDEHAVLLRELALSGDYEVIDLPAVLELERETPAALKALFFDPVHPRVELHQRIGAAIADALGAARASDRP